MVKEYLGVTLSLQKKKRNKDLIKQGHKSLTIFLYHSAISVLNFKGEVHILYSTLKIKNEAYQVINIRLN